MRPLFSFACLSLVSLLSACSTPSDGYYDEHGNWIYTNPNSGHHEHPPLPGGLHNSRYDNYNHSNAVTTVTTTYSYDRPGYYNREGAYLGPEADFVVPQDMLPPRGMCRVWFPDRAPASQPGIESCDGINARVPAGAYIIYGG